VRREVAGEEPQEKRQGLGGAATQSWGGQAQDRFQLDGLFPG
jgi:hypothetical protein